MSIYINEKTLDSVLLDAGNMSVISENFKYLVDNLISFIDPNIGDHEEVPEIKGGQRRIVRALRGPQLGYQYKTLANKAKITAAGTKTIKAFGTNILVEEWTVSHPYIKDEHLGEIYPTADKQGPRGPYTCLITARVALSRKKPTRCYIQCNCMDFKTTFYEMLNGQGYTNPQNLPASTGKKALAPAMCKHIYAIYTRYYTDIVRESEPTIDQNPVLFGGKNQPALAPAPTIQLQREATTKDEATLAVIKALRAEHKKLVNNIDAYLDMRTQRAGGGSYHKYPFYVISNGGRYKIVYRNLNIGKFLNVPNNPDIWKWFNFKKDHKLLRDLIFSLGEMPKKLQDELATKGRIVTLESVDSSIFSLIEEIS